MAFVLLLCADVFTVTIQRVHLRSGTDLSEYVTYSNITETTIKADRGTIYDRNGVVIAQDSRTYDVYCVLDPTLIASGKANDPHVEDPAYTANILSEVLGGDYDTIYGLLTQTGVYQTELGNIGRNISESQKSELAALQSVEMTKGDEVWHENHLPGVFFRDSVQRVYPLGVFASNLIGYSQPDENNTERGKMGLELFLDSYLTGTDGTRKYQSDSEGNVLPGMTEEVISAVDGYDVYLTLDQTIQEALEHSFTMSEERFNVKRAWGSVMEVDTGKVVAWGQTPEFDPNVLEIEEYTNYGTENPYEPGSTLKTFTWAAAIDAGAYDGQRTTDGYEFCYTSGSDNVPIRTTKDKAYGCIYNSQKNNYKNITYDEGLMVSANTVAAAIQNEAITADIHLEYLKKFGFFSEVNTDGIPEQVGTLNFTWPADKISLSYGQGSTVTMLQMLQAYSAIFSDGTMVKPYFVESIRDSYDNSKVIYQAQTTVSGNPISAESAAQVREILTRTVTEGSAKYYQIPECTVAGKTGTTEVASGGTYDTSTIISSIMVGMPANDPKVMVYYCVEMDYDRYGHYYTEAAINLLRSVAMAYGLSDDMSEQETVPEEPEETVSEIVTYVMPSLVNHSRQFADAQLEGISQNVYYLGNGDSVIAQFPEAYDSVDTGQRIFLLTDTESFSMPDMTGWTRKDVVSLWAVSGFAFRLSGEGKVVSQSVPAGTTVTSGTTIEIVFD